MLKLIVTVGTILVTVVGASATTSLDELARRLGADKVRADFVLAVDLSGSMLFEARPGARGQAPPGRRRIDVVRRVLPTLLRAVPAGDYVAVVGFSGAVHEDPALLFTAWNPRQDLPAAVSRLERLIPDPRGDTDLGLALEILREKATRTGHNAVQFLYLITDGEHEPPASSPYHAKHGAAPWERLSGGWQAILQEPTRVVRAFQIGLFDVENPGVVRQVWPQATFLPVDSAERLAAFFEEQKERLFKERLRAIVDLEVRRANLNVAAPPKNTRLNSGFAVVPATVSVASNSRLGLHITGEVRALGSVAEVTCVGPVALELGPGQNRAFDLPLGLAVRREPWLRQRVVSDVKVAWTAASTVVEPALTELGLGAIRGPRAVGEATVRVEATVGRLPVWLLAAAAVWVILALVVGPRILRPAVAGTANVASTSAAVHSVPFLARDVLVGGAERANVRLSGTSRAALTIRAARQLLRWRLAIAHADGVMRGGNHVTRGQSLAPGVEYRVGPSAVTFVGLRLVPPRALQFLVAAVVALPAVIAVAAMTFGPDMVVAHLAGAVVPTNGAAIPLQGPTMVIGSAPGAQIRIAGAPLVATLVARNAGGHSHVEIAPASGSSVLVNGCRVLTSQPLDDGAEIHIGDQQLRYRSKL